MSERAIKIEGFDELTHQPARIERQAACAGNVRPPALALHQEPRSDRLTGLTRCQIQALGGGMEH